MEQITPDPIAAPQGAAAQPIVTLTDKAVEMIKVAMERDGAVGSALRVGVLGGGCSGFQYNLSFTSDQAPDDTAFEQGGVKILIDETSRPHLEGMTLDYVVGLNGAGFKFLNPNATRTCGCGSSFAT